MLPVEENVAVSGLRAEQGNVNSEKAQTVHLMGVVTGPRPTVYSELLLAISEECMLGKFLTPGVPSGKTWGRPRLEDKFSQEPSSAR